jgi:hypothetical protein
MNKTHTEFKLLRNYVLEHSLTTKLLHMLMQIQYFLRVFGCTVVEIMMTQYGQFSGLYLGPVQLSIKLLTNDVLCQPLA